MLVSQYIFLKILVANWVMSTFVNYMKAYTCHLAVIKFIGRSWFNMNMLITTHSYYHFANNHDKSTKNIKRWIAIDRYQLGIFVLMSDLVFFFVKEDTVIMSLGCHLIDIYTNTFPFTQLITLQSMNKAMFKKTYRSNLI